VLTEEQALAAALRELSTNEGTDRLIRLMYRAIKRHQLSTGDRVNACAFLLADSIVWIGPDNAKTMRAAIIATIDGYALNIASERPTSLDEPNPLAGPP
jgi:hypothetical protein